MNIFKIGGFFTIKCFDSNGNLKWEDTNHNIVVNEGIQHILDVVFMGGTQKAHFYVGLISGTPTPSSTDTLASITEFSSYTEGARQEYVEGFNGTLEITNNNSKAIFSINGNGTIGGSFITDVDSGTSGILIAENAFANGDRNVATGDTIEVQYDISGTSS